VAARNLTAGEVVAALQEQNVQVASGVLNQPPVPGSGAFELNIETQGRLAQPKQFERVVKTDPDGRVTRVSDIARVELGAEDYGQNGYLELATFRIAFCAQPSGSAYSSSSRRSASR
jgi:multidrug efflux pump subunit AcrB